MTEAVLERTALGCGFEAQAFSPEGAVDQVTRLIVNDIETALCERGKALWIGAGGGTPKPVYEALSLRTLDWKHITLSQVDERFVAQDAEASNTRMMAKALGPALAAGLRFESLIRDLSSLDACARKAETLMQALGGGRAPQWDTVLLGMGGDTHYASLFPGHDLNATAYETRNLVAGVSPTGTELEPVLPRVTLTPRALNAARHIILYITGKAKLEALKSAIADPDRDRHPIGAYLSQCPVPVDIIWSQ